ncbi:M15 family metallopeptidase [Veronia pacifica]|nr:M15 family metallopeptidase [Veronia pacifica]
MNSRHLTGHAVDLGAWVSGEVRWDWPLYYRIADAVKAASIELGIPIEWGGDWKSFPDGPHFQLPWAEYPVEDS